MKLVTIIDHLKDADAFPRLAGAVAGAAEFADAAEAGERWSAVPHAFVLRLTEDVSESIDTGGSQPLEEWFGVVVCVDNRGDKTGVTADDTLDDVRAELLAGLKGWAPDDERSPFEYRGYETMQITRARVWRRFDFSTLSGDC